MTSYPLSLGMTSAFSAPIGGTPTKEGEVSMIRSLHASPGVGRTPVLYGYTGVTLASNLPPIARGDRFQGRFRFSAGIFDRDMAGAVAEDPEAALSLIIGPYRLSTAGALTIQRLVTPQFYRIAVRSETFAERPDGVRRLSLAFYSDPRQSAGGDFVPDRLDISRIPMPSLYLEDDGGRAVINAKLQSLDTVAPGAG